MKWIFGILALLLLTVSVISLWHFNNLWLPLMAGLGAIFGVLMALTYPWALTMQVGIIIGLLLALMLTVYGLKHATTWHGRALAISGIIMWIAIGIVGLSTGS